MAAATIVFAILIAASLVLALMAKKGHHSTNVRDFFIASRQFGGFLVFFLSVGEIYSIATLLGFSGIIYAKGTYGIWYLGYFMLASAVAYFLNPLIWRAGKFYDAVTIADLFKGHFKDHAGARVLELTVTISAITFLIPWGQLQFGGLLVALSALGWHINTAVLVIFAGVLACLYIFIAGIRAPAYVAVLKDALLILTVVITGGAALAHTHLSTIFHTGVPLVSNHLTAPQLRFSMSTIAFQALGFFMLPFNTQNLFTAKSEQTIRRTQMFMPLYMVMFPFLVVVAYYQLGTHEHLHSANGAFMAAALQLLPRWVLGIVVAGAALTGLLVLAGTSLAIGPLVSRNLFGHVPEQKQRGAAQVVIVLYLALSIVLTLAAPSLLTTILNTAFFGITQFFPGMVAIMFFRRANPWAIAAGIIVGDVLSVGLFALKVPTHDFNIGAVALVVNVAILVIGSLLAGRRQVTPVALRGTAALSVAGD
jgi:solute:Na+ symporter, SSS family